MLLIVVSYQGLAQESPNGIQEQESAEVFLEEYTDEFQNTFFEALKQKGIQNYDRAINLFLKCKQLQPDNTALDHELAKVYYLDKKYIPAQQYAVEALIGEPTNYWFLENLLNIADKQGLPFQSFENDIPSENEVLKDNLAKYYFKKGDYKSAKDILKKLNTNLERSLLLQKINDSLDKQEGKWNDPVTEKHPIPEKESNDPLHNLRKELESLAESKSAAALEMKSKEAIENYPLQPDFYYYRGVALIQMGRSEEAILVLEEGLNYLFDNDDLANKCYKELADAYHALGNDSKANEYLSKIKSGFQ